jgi:hypothetical protein
MQALQIHAGPVARAHLRECAAGGPKGLALNALDRFIFAEWLAGSSHTVHLVGASIGAWRMACACLADPDAALVQLADDYIHQRYEHKPGKAPTASHVSEVFGAKLAERFGGREAEVLSHPRYRLHVFTSRGRHLLRREGRVRTPLGYFGAFATNAVSRRAMGTWLERVVFHDARDTLPFPLHDYRTRTVGLDASNLSLAILASCSIPFWLDAVHDIPGGPRGAYWDGGITDYHLHLDYAAMGEGLAGRGGGPGLVLYPHFQATLVPGWLDKALRHRHRASERLANVIVLAPNPEWVKTLPGGKLPDRGDFKAWGDDFDGRVAAWRRATAESARLAEEFAQLVRQPSIDALPLL